MFFAAACASLFAALFPLSALAAPPEGFAQCGCLERSFDRRLRDAAAVFTGTVKTMEYDDSVIKEGSGGRWTKNLPGADDPYLVTFDVDHLYKGEAKDNVFVLNTSKTQYTCSGYPFKEGGRYLVFAFLRKTGEGSASHDLYGFPPETYGVGGLCGGTKEVEKAAKDLARLKDVKPEPAHDTTEEHKPE